MYEELINRLRELQVLTEHCDEQLCFDCENRELCDKHDNKTLSGTYKEAADAIEELQQTVDHYKGCSDDWYKEACDYHDMILRKCTVYGATHSEASDWRKKYVACGMYDKEWNGVEIIRTIRHSGMPKLPEQPIDGQMDLLKKEAT